MAGMLNLATVPVKITKAQLGGLNAATERLRLTYPQIVERVTRAALDGAAREIARLTTAGPESSEGWQQRCNQCRSERAEQCASCPGLGPSFDEKQEAKRKKED